MAKPNYKHQKKQREQLTRQKKEEKLRRRNEKTDVKDDTAVAPAPDQKAAAFPT